jgi:hypothetical protein
MLVNEKPSSQDAWLTLLSGPVTAGGSAGAGGLGAVGGVSGW